MPYPPCCRCNPPAAPYQYCDACRHEIRRYMNAEKAALDRELRELEAQSEHWGKRH